MLTAVAIAIPAVALVAFALGLVVARIPRRRSGNYLAGRASGYQAGIRHGENARRALHARVDTLTAALDEMGERYDRKAAEPLVHAVNGLIGDDTFTMLGESLDPDEAYEPADVTHHDYWAGGAR